ncbi:uncharacterized protein [Coffea arabica]|uniref:Uncharacterized protein isoform X3 n=1 Tax=Coffea arabica TaxID=13443 RepID=A0A6P6X079_COFAR|nr:uncharacterized protein LOC113733879 isoform X1 [Coffea arabica]XP_027121009.1 uncharacterized protein LOC113738047 isoform X1 [Coffea arabica]
MEEFDEDDFGDLYTDVKVQAGPALNSVPPLAQFSLDTEISDSSEANERFTAGGSGADNAEEEEEEETAAVALDEGQEWSGNGSESESESEDDLNIVLNDDEEVENGNEVINGGQLGFRVGGIGGGLDHEDEAGIKGEDEGSKGRGNHDSCCTGGVGDVGFELGNRGKVGFNGGDCSVKYECMKSKAAAVLSNLKCNGSARVASYSSQFVRGYWEHNCWTPRFGKNSLVPQRGHNFSLPRSRTIIDVNIDAFEWKPWRHPGADITDFFNFGLDEDSWKCYCSCLDGYREQPNEGNPAYNPWRHSMMRSVSQISCRHEQLEMPKGEAILVEDSICERQASVDVRHSVDRDSDVIIQIHVQDMEDLSSFGNMALDQGSSHVAEASHEGESGDIGIKNEDMVCFNSASKDDLPILKGPTEEKWISIPERCSNDTSTCAGNPVYRDSDNCGSLQVSDTHEHDHEELADSDSDGSAEDRSSDDSKKCIGSVTSNTTSTVRESESSYGLETRGTNFSPSSSHDIKSRCGAYPEPDKIYDHVKRVSPNSESEAVTFDCNSSKDFRSHSIKMKSGAYEYFSRGRNPINRKLKFPERKSTRISKFKSHLEYEDAFYLSNPKKLHDVCRSTSACGNQRNRCHSFDFSERQDFSCYEGLEYLISHRGKRLYDYQSSGAYSQNSHQRGCRVSRYEREQCYNQTVSGKHHFTEQRIPRFSGDTREKDLDHYDGEDSVSGLESLDFHGPGELIFEKSQLLDCGNHARWKWKSGELKFRRKLKNCNFICEHKYSNNMTRENFRSIQCREGDIVQRKYDRQLQYGRGKVRGPLRGKRRFDSPLSGCETIRCRNSEDEKPQTVGRVRAPGAPYSRIYVSERCSKQGKHNCVGRYSGGTKFGFSDGMFDSDENIKHADDQDDFAGRRHYGQSEVLEWREEECNSWYPEHGVLAEGTLYPFNKTSGGKGSVAKHGSVYGGKLIDLSEPEQNRYKLSREGGVGSKFLESPNVSRRDNVQRTRPRCWDSTDKDMVVWDSKSSRCSEAGSSICFDRYEYFKRNEDSEQRTFKGLNDSRLEKVARADNTKAGTFLVDANWRNKFPNGKRNDSPDIEEGQIVTEDLNEKPKERISASRDKTNITGTKAISRENPRILEIIAKMEKRRERFKEPISLKTVSEKNGKPFTADGAETVETKQLPRPARKRKWAGS